MKFNKSSVEGYLRGSRAMMKNMGFDCHSLEWRWHDGAKGTTLGVVFQRGEPGDDAARVLDSFCLGLVDFDPHLRLICLDEMDGGMGAAAVLEVI